MDLLIFSLVIHSSIELCSNSSVEPPHLSFKIAVIENSFVNDDSLSSAVGSQADCASDIRLKILLASFNI